MLTLLSVLLTVIASAEVPSSPRTGHQEMRGTFNYYTTTSNYLTGGGSIDDLPNGGSYTNALGEFQFIYDWRSDWRFMGGASLAWAESSDGTLTRTNSGLNEVFFGAQNWYEAGRFDIALDGIFVYPIFKPDLEADEALLGEGAIRARGGSWLIYPMRNLRPFGYLGFEYRDGGRSYLLPYNVGVKWRPKKNFWVQGEYRGFETMIDDADTDNRDDRELYLETVNGGSFRYYSVNPSMSELAVQAGTRFGALQVFGEVAMTINGSSTADGYSFTAGISYSPTDAERGAISEDGFDIRKERYDESLFQEREPSEPTRDEPVFREDPNFVEPPPPPPEPEQPAAPPAPKRPRKTPKQQAIEESQNVELQLEMHHVKPKKKKKKKKSSKKLDKLLNEAEKAVEED